MSKKDEKKTTESVEVESKEEKKASKSKKGKTEKVQEVLYYGPKGIQPTDRVFAVCHIYASFNNTVIVTILFKKSM
jgi:ribosomal protein S11